MLSDRSYLRLSFEIIHQDVQTLLSFVEPCDDNLSTYSHVIYTLLLRVCTEVEAIFKLVADVNNCTSITSKRSPNIYDYRSLEKFLGFEKRLIGLHFWRPTVKYVEPFKDWTTSNPPVSWYSAYNKVKHDREANFAYANFENLIFAYSGLFQAVIQTNILPTENAWDHFVAQTKDKKSEAVFPKYKLSQVDGKS